MLQDYSTKSVCVYDNGLFVELAVLLSKYFGQVYYFTPWESSFPKSNDIMPGTGIEGVTRVNEFWDIIDDVDLFVFPDIYSSSVQLYLDKLGKRVWGSRRGDSLELYRKETKEYLEMIGLPVSPYAVVQGLDELREYLKEHDNQWIKISFTRGDMETFYSKNYKFIEPKLDELEHTLGLKKKIIEFIVEDAIEDAVELGYDGYTVDGQFPSKAILGIEIKDKGYVGVFTPYAQLPEAAQHVNSYLSDALRVYKYRNFFSTEIRLTEDDTPYLIDPCMRMGSPPGELYQYMITNWPDILWFGAEGKVIDPISRGKYGAEILLHSDWADKNWLAVQFPPEMRENVKFRQLAIVDDEYYIVPQVVGLPEIGAVVAVAETLEDAIEQAKEYARKVEGYFIDIYPDAMDDAIEEVKKLKDRGITFGPKQSTKLRDLLE
jgi:hypothetical protein